MKNKNILFIAIAVIVIGFLVYATFAPPKIVPVDEKIPEQVSGIDTQDKIIAVSEQTEISSEEDSTGIIKQQVDVEQVDANEVYVDLPVDYQGNTPEGTFKAMIGDEVVFTNGPDILQITMLPNNGVVPTLCSEENNQFLCTFGIAVEVTPNAAQRLAQATSVLDMLTMDLPEGPYEHLSENIVFYLNNEKLDELIIPAELKGRAETKLQVQGLVKGSTLDDAVTNAKKKHDAVLKVLLDVSDEQSAVAGNAYSID
ncbi:hypothetical protein COV18_03735 [Candidatus Woesearchaeota archaeon CG10_big_fil_rev_8_21_14_0_10_37_12]|nr:MAG: hypothetical protein COV18_03735 [Candidatus Woesearchaeota archaeon CG10_big_fil_rev_8_21_14_0_10_37_12]